MKAMKRITSLLMTVCIAASMVLTAHAETTGPIEISDARFEGKTWDEVVQQYLDEHDLNGANIALGYKNLITGEEHYYNGDEYEVAASLYKVPMNMVYAERISKGEMTFDTEVRGVQYDKLMRGSIVESNNEFSDYLRSALGGYPTYRRTFAHYMGEDADTVDSKYYENNYFTARQMITCLDTLYKGGEETFPKVIEYMKQAEPEKYFNSFSQNYTVAHKYGYLETGSTLQMNDSGIVYTDEPIAIVMFTNGIKRPYTCLANYCTLMAEYTQYNTAVRIEQEEKAAAEEAAKKAQAEAMEKLDLMALTREDGTNLTLEAMLADEDLRTALYLGIGTVGLTAVTLLPLLIAAIRKKIKFLPGLVTVLLCGVTGLVCIFGPHMNTIISAPKGDPQQVVTEFFEALAAQDFETAYTYLDYYSSLGLENESDDEATRLVQAQLRSSYSYELYGDCVVNGLTAKQQVLVQHFDVKRMQERLGDKTNEAMRQLVQNSPEEEIYDENDQYRPEATQKAYMAALNQLLEKPEYYRTTSGMELELVYTSNGWRIQASEALLQALSGGIGY